jgi:chitinase
VQLGYLFYGSGQFGRRRPAGASHLPANVFPRLRQDQVAIGLPASVNAGNGFTSVAEVRSALDCLIKGLGCGTYHPHGVYPNLRGLMTWSINWDRFNGFEFSHTHGAYLHALP